MEPSSFEKELECNRQAYESLKDQIRHDFAGQYVALAFGRVVAAGPSLDEVHAALGRLEPLPNHIAVFHAEEEPNFQIGMNPETFEREDALHRKAWEEMREQVCRDHPGQYAALANGRLIAISPDFDTADAAVKQLQPVPEYYLVFPVDEGPIFEPIEAYYFTFL
jgi:hypothetical protein